MVDPAELARDVVPYVSAVAGAYGRALWEKIQDESADSAVEASVGVGRRLLRRLLGRGESRPGVERAVGDLIDDPGDEDAVAALRLQIRKAVAADPGLAADLAGLLPGAGTTVIASGERSVAAQTVSGVVATGDNVRIQR